MSGAITATAAVVAAMTTAEIFTAVAVVGGVVGAVGAVTGIKPLQYAGMALGAIGGVGALAVSAGVFAGDALATGASFAGDAADVGTIAASAGTASGASATTQALIDAGLEGGTQSAGIASDVMAGGAWAGNANSGDIVSALSGQVSVPDPVPTSAAVNAAPPDVNPQAAISQGDVTPAGSAPTPTTAPDTTFNTPPTSTNPVGPIADPAAAPASPTVVANDTATGAGTVTGTPASGSTVTGAPYSTEVADFGRAVQVAPGNTAPPSVFGKLLDTITGTKGGATLAVGGVQALASFISGATSSLTPAQVEALKAQAAANQASANLQTQQGNLAATQVANMNGPIPVARRTGMINTPVPANVTGAV